jgi:DNA end-binding protein Ku
VRDDLLALYLLRYPTEIREPEGIEGAELDLESVGVTSKEVQMAVKIVEGMTEPWDPSDYEDQYTEDVMALVEKKIKSGAVHEITEPGREEPEAERGTVLDLMPLLKQSLAQTKQSGSAAVSKSPRRKAPTRKTGKPRARRKTA